MGGQRALEENLRRKRMLVEIKDKDGDMTLVDPEQVAAVIECPARKAEKPKLPKDMPSNLQQALGGLMKGSDGGSKVVLRSGHTIVIHLDYKAVKKALRAETSIKGGL